MVLLQNIFQNNGLPFSNKGINMHNQLKNVFMKFAKLSVIALSMGLFLTSCGNGSTEAAKTDSTTTTTSTVTATPPPATPDTMAAGAAKPDTTKTTTTTTTETKKEEKK